MTVNILIAQLDCSVCHLHCCWCHHMQDLRFSHGVVGMWCCCHWASPNISKDCHAFIFNAELHYHENKGTNDPSKHSELLTNWQCHALSNTAVRTANPDLHCIHRYLPPLCSILLLSAAAFRWSASTITSCSAFCCSLVKLAVKTWYHSGSLAWMSVNIQTLSQQFRAPATSPQKPKYSH